MRWILLTLLVLTTGCRTFVGPFAPRPALKVDDPNLPLEAQRKQGRELLSLPVETNDVAPRSGAAFPGLSNFNR